MADPTVEITSLRSELAGQQAKIDSLEKRLDVLPRDNPQAQIALLLSRLDNNSREIESLWIWKNSLHGADGVRVNNSIIALDMQFINQLVGSSSGNSGGQAGVVSGCLNGVFAVGTALFTSLPAPP